jgi:hypothetical protein
VANGTDLANGENARAKATDPHVALTEMVELRQHFADPNLARPR